MLPKCNWLLLSFLAPCLAMLATLGVAAASAATLLILRRHQWDDCGLEMDIGQSSKLSILLGYPILTHSQTSCTLPCILYLGYFRIYVLDTCSRWDDVRLLVSFLFVDKSL